MPTVTKTRAIRDQYVDRTDRTLVNSERSAPANPARPAGRGTPALIRAAGVSIVAISGHLSCISRLGAGAGRDARVELHAGGRQFYECLFQRGVRRGQLVQPDPVLERQVAEPGRDQASHDQHVVAVIARRAAGPGGPPRPPPPPPRPPPA